MSSNRDLLQRFYAAFDRRDAEAMAACYTDDVRFEDPAFGPLTGDQARGMWRMLCQRGKDLRVVASDIEADASRIAEDKSPDGAEDDAGHIDNSRGARSV